MAHKGEKSNGSHYSSSGATKNVYSKKKRTSFVNDNAWWEKLSDDARVSNSPGLMGSLNAKEYYRKRDKEPTPTWAKAFSTILKQYSMGFDNRTKSYKGKPTMVDNQGNLKKSGYGSN